MEYIDYESSNDCYDATEIIDFSNHDLGCPMPREGTESSCENLLLEQMMWLKWLFLVSLRLPSLLKSRM